MSFFMQSESARRRMTSGGRQSCADRSGAETSNLRGTDVPRCTKKDILLDVLFMQYESARRDSNPRPSPWQGDAPPLSHSRLSCLDDKTYIIIPLFLCQPLFSRFFFTVNLVARTTKYGFGLAFCSLHV